MQAGGYLDLAGYGPGCAGSSTSVKECGPWPAECNHVQEHLLGTGGAEVSTVADVKPGTGSGTGSGTGVESGPGGDDVVGLWDVVVELDFLEG